MFFTNQLLERKVKKIAEKNSSQNFEVIIKSEKDDTVVVTSVEDMSKEWLSKAMSAYDAANQKYSTYLKDGNSSFNNVTPEYLDELAENAQGDLYKIQLINSIIDKEINKDDIVGKTVECIESNINTEIKISYENIINKKKETKQIEEVKNFIKNFNEQIKLKNITRNSISTAYTTGTYISYLRHEHNNYFVNYYPLGVCEISDYDINGEPIVLFNIQELRNRLRKIYKKNKKNKALFFEKIEEEVKANYPKEVYDAFIAKERYAKLDVRYTGVIRVGNRNKKYGLSPIFRALKPLSMLETFDNSDRINSKAKAKKIIHQKLRKEVMGQDFRLKGFDEMAYAHTNFMEAFKMQTVVCTTPPSVESIKYIEPTVELTDIKTVNSYRSRVLSTLGIGFLMNTGDQSVSTATISVTQLLRIINTISEQLEDILKKWYKQILLDNNFDIKFCPKVKVIDSEQLDFALKKELATTLYTIFNLSLETTLDILGININDEKAKRIKENEEGLDEIFKCRQTAYTSSGKGEIVDKTSGRPKDESDDANKSKQNYDKEYNDTRS